jgi:hypothetical protein
MGAELFQAGEGTDGQTNKHDEANSRFLKFCERACKLFSGYPVSILINYTNTSPIY